MISVIIPTMWRGKELATMLPILLEHDKVGEIIIIDNDQKARNIKIPYVNKIKVLEQEKNIFCHPAWNLGVKIAKYNRICLMNDDIIFDEKVLDLVYDKITEKVGIIGVNGKGIKDFFIKSPLMKIAPADHTMNWRGYGTLMFMHKKNYLNIPDELAIWWGDCWIYDYNIVQGRQNFMINNLCVKTQMRTTSRAPEIQKMIDKENQIFKSFFDEMYKKYSKTDNYLTPLIAEITYDAIIQYS